MEWARPVGIAGTIRVCYIDNTEEGGIMDDVTSHLSRRIARLERRNRFVVAIAAISTIAAVGAAVAGRATAAQADAGIHDVLRVRALDVVDAHGITRVKIAAPLPHAIVAGRQLRSRGGRPEDTMSGMLLFDAEGQERSGYATVDHGYSNVLLTLDDKTRQHAMFIAEPTGATTLRLFNGDTRDRLDLGMDEDGPSLTMVRHGEQIYRLPPRP